MSRALFDETSAAKPTAKELAKAIVTDWRVWVFAVEDVGCIRRTCALRSRWVGWGYNQPVWPLESKAFPLSVAARQLRSPSQRPLGELVASRTTPWPHE